MAKPNYAFEKRQRELAKKKKKEEKRLQKAGLANQNSSLENPTSTLSDEPKPS